MRFYENSGGRDVRDGSRHAAAGQPPVIWSLIGVITPGKWIETLPPFQSRTSRPAWGRPYEALPVGYKGTDL